MKKKNIRYAALILVSILLLLVGNRVATRDNPYFGGGYSSDSYYRAKILRFTKVESQVEEFGGMENHYTQLEMDVLLLEGVMKGETVSISHRVDEDLTAKPYPYTEGEKVLVTFDFDQDDNVIWYLADHLREGYLFALVGAFLFLLILFGRRQGVNTVLSLALTVAAVFFVMLPAIIKGYNIYWVTFLVSCYIIVMTLGVVIGFSPKSFSAAVGCIGGVGVAGLITVIMQNLMKISGLINEDSSFVMYINPVTPINLKGLIFSAIVIGALGAVMDVAMSISSSLEELLLHNPDLSFSQVVTSGLNIGRDIMGTMANTLVLAYVGSCLHEILLLMAHNSSLASVINREMVAVEVLQSIAGSIGILCTVPVAAVVTGLVHQAIVKKRLADGAKEQKGE